MKPEIVKELLSTLTTHGGWSFKTRQYGEALILTGHKTLGHTVNLSRHLNIYPSDFPNQTSLEKHLSRTINRWNK